MKKGSVSLPLDKPANSRFTGPELLVLEENGEIFLPQNFFKIYQENIWACCQGFLDAKKFGFNSSLFVEDVTKYISIPILHQESKTLDVINDRI